MAGLGPGVLWWRYHGISGVPDVADRQQIAFQGLCRVKYQSSIAKRSQFGPDAVRRAPLEPYRRGKSGGGVADPGQRGILRSLFDKEMYRKKRLRRRLTHESNEAGSLRHLRARPRRTAEREAKTSVSVAALSGGKSGPGVVIGAEARYLRHYEGLIPRMARKGGKAVFLRADGLHQMTRNTSCRRWNAQDRTGRRRSAMGGAARFWDDFRGVTKVRGGWGIGILENLNGGVEKNSSANYPRKGGIQGLKEMGPR